jgi:hypothetical protein
LIIPNLNILQYNSGEYFFSTLDSRDRRHAETRTKICIRNVEIERRISMSNFDPATFALEIEFNEVFEGEFNPELKTAEFEDDDVEEGLDDEYIDDEPRPPYNEDKLAYWGELDMAGWTMEEMLSQGLIEVDTYPFFEDEKEPKLPQQRVVCRKYTIEELEHFEVINF